MGSVSDRFRVKQMTGRLPKANSSIAFNRLTANAPHHQAAERAEAEGEALKGTYLGNCNLTACQRPGATWWNFGSRSWYCRSCALMLNRENARWVQQDIGRPVLCEDRSIYLEYPEEVMGV